MDAVILEFHDKTALNVIISYEVQNFYNGENVYLSVLFYFIN